MFRLFPLVGGVLAYAAVLACVSLQAVIDPDRPAAAAKADLNANAALKYWRGFANLPKLDKDEQDKIIREAATMPLTPRVKEIVKLAQSSLHELYNGAAVPDCGWGLTEEDGVDAIVPELPAARVLVGLACLRARLRFEEGNNAPALDDVFAGLTLARHLSVDGAPVTLLVAMALENTTTEVLATYLPKLDAATLKGLSARLGKLPAGGNLAVAIAVEERIGCAWFEKKVRGIKDPNELVQLVGFLEAGEHTDKKDQIARGKAFLEACGGTVEGVAKMAEEVRPYYAAWVKKAMLPPAEFEKAMDADGKRMEKNPVFKLVFPALARLRQAEARLEVRRAMLKAAIAVQQDGKDALKNHPEPFGDGPFGHEVFDGGFELKSKLKYTDKSWVLTVGKRK
jgi:hypothetical protein